MNINGKWIKIQSYKHNGHLHRYWAKSFVLENSEDWLIVASKTTKVVEANGRKWYTKEPAVSFFSKTNWFNVIAMLKEQGIVFYINIASPTLLDGEIAKYIDYDLDLKVFQDGNIRLLDKNEFVRNSATYNYSADLQEIITHKQDEVFTLVQNGAYPFSHDLVRNLFATFLEQI